MTETRTRYPGAQPFSDNDFSRRIFFGRAQESMALTDQILANRLTVVYAKSGLGKTSLLNAGVAPLVREASCLPLFVRVNDIVHGPVASVLEGIRTEAERQEVEYVEGDTGSLWSFFKSVEFWRGDLLLEPVLVLDQFEELFTLQPEPVREEFLSQLGYIIRGVPPPSLLSRIAGDNAPPALRIVLSLREDFLGVLEEVSDRIPQILDHRFRLTPLSVQAGIDAMTGPAALDDPAFATRPFALDPRLIETIVSHLSVRSVAKTTARTRYLEPFHLQLICQHVEQVVSRLQRKSPGLLTVQIQDLGGEAALTRTLRDFYINAVRSVPERHLRPVVRRLCEEFLISPEGRRLSLDEREIRRQLRLPDQTLRQLVESRLLRADQRSENIYYELSHDALVEPVLGTRRAQALVVGGIQIAAGSLLLLIAMLFGLFFLIGMMAAALEGNAQPESWLGALLLEAVLLPPAIWLARSGGRTCRRYRRHTPEECAESLPVRQSLAGRLLSWSELGLGGLLMALSAIALPFSFGLLLVVHADQGRIPAWFPELMKTPEILRLLWLLYERPWQEMGWVALEYLTILWVGWLLFRAGLSSGAARGRLPSALAAAHPMSAMLRISAGAAALLLALLNVAAWRWCLVAADNFPGWLPPELRVVQLSDLCREIHGTGPHSVDLGLYALFIACLFGLSLYLIGKGIRQLYYLTRRPPTERGA